LSPGSTSARDEDLRPAEASEEEFAEAATCGVPVKNSVSLFGLNLPNHLPR
jgi:hypothetical protein